MRPIVRAITNPEHILSYALGFVVAWFGVNEILAPQQWVTFAPPFLGVGSFAIDLVIVHGLVLVACALLLFGNAYRKVAAALLALVFVEIIVNLVIQTGLSDIAVRDIGLCGMAIALALMCGMPESDRR